MTGLVCYTKKINKLTNKYIFIKKTSTHPRTGKLSELALVGKLLFFGSLISDQGGSKLEIRRRTIMSKSAMILIKSKHSLFGRRFFQ